MKHEDRPRTGCEGLRKWIDINRGTFSQGNFEVSKFMIRLLRHDESALREDDESVRLDNLALVNPCLMLLNTSLISDQSKDLHEVLSVILFCKTVYCLQMTSARLSIRKATRQP